MNEFTELHAVLYEKEGQARLLLPALGRTFSEGDEIIAREDRSSSGKLRRDLQTQKKTFTFEYDLLSNEQWTQFTEFIGFAMNKVLNLMLIKASRTYNYDVLLSPISYTRKSILNGGAWEGVTITLTEI